MSATVLVVIVWFLLRGHTEGLNLIAALIPAVPVVIWAYRWSTRAADIGARRHVAEGLDQAADVLAETIRTQWEDAARDRRLFYPARIAVRWRRSALAVSGRLADAADGLGRWRNEPLPGLARVVPADVRTGDVFSIGVVPVADEDATDGLP